MNSSSLVDQFRNYFDIAAADTQELQELAFRIRYDVYCREFGYEKEEDCPGGLEHDDYDASSVHSIIVHRPTSQPAGCVRLVLPPPDEDDFVLPLERFCGESLNDPALHPSRIARGNLGEVSRLAVHTQFRRRKGEAISPIGEPIEYRDLTEDERRAFPLLGLALFCAGTSMMASARREHAFVMMERRLVRKLQPLGFPFVQVGEAMEYHGSRAAYYANLQQVLDSMRPDVRSLYEYVHQGLCTEISP
ncbi:MULTISPECIES: PEP-CTERM/exosortase system-associated acyltransferase [unclassified Ectothiorhodospira]|uniref:PEP-CTERM/exosortase system-associated acyltransferase n=1 Tax=unclassified Ectothiorhodospira TaxID=2684909 RepID=UPI001EE8F0F0|nr:MULTISPECIES: PEP-CTERM/exosortase system-associated acyltransferase [unclassified Ectothiorhodospira]MCG5517211.1 PEP-CTERM/exosortase system-associated acyltransferase [Ectothiorhodospira sp. 9100]MCG5520133.1 PEP-CTERM/exosortase system-associated acyltransferase [Ectothiorhodospira sp. 9905]